MASRQNHSHLGWASIKQSFFLLGLLSTAVIGDYSEFKKLFDASKANLLSSPLGFSDVPGLGGHSQSDDHAQRLQRRSGNLPLIITSFCSETIWPGILTQSGLPPALSGFALDPGVSKRLEVSHDWQGRVWARTNCTFRSDHDDNPLLSSGRACFTGDCGPYVQCKGTGEIPATLAEFAFTSPTGHAYYDISLVDGYNLGMEILSLHQLSGKNAITGISTELTDPVCIGNPSDPSQLAVPSYGFGPVAQWCPFNLIVNPPTLPEGTVYLYPDGAIESQSFDPCYSACGKSHLPQDCCTGEYNDRTRCLPNDYARGAKSVCPDAYSYAFDDQSSTFIIPSGGGFEVRFCPTGKSTNILSTQGDQLRALAVQSSSGHRLRKREGGHDWTAANGSDTAVAQRQRSVGTRGRGSLLSLGGLATDSAGGFGGNAQGRRPGHTNSWVPFVSIAVAWWMVLDMKKKRALKQGEAEKQRIQDFHDTVDAEETRRRRQGQRKQQQRHRSTRRNQSWGSEAEGWISTDHEDDLALQDLGFSAAELDRMRHEFEQSQRGHEVGYGDSVSYFQHFQQQQPASILQPPRQSGIPAFQQPTTQYAAPVSPAFDPIFGPSAYTLPSRAQPKMSSCFTDPQEDRPRKKRAKRVSFSESEDEAGKARKRGRTLEREERGDVKGVQGVQVRVRMMDGVEGRGRKRPRSQGSMGSVEF